MKFTNDALICWIGAAAAAGGMANVHAFTPSIYETAIHKQSLSSSHHRSLLNSYASVGSLLHNNKRLAQRTILRAVDDDDDDDDEDDDYDDEIDSAEPLSNGVDSVSWLPTVVGKQGDTADYALTRTDSEIIPLFPLGGIVYTPNSEHTLNIFEPRYREMYSDILMNGTKRFAVSMSHPTEPGRFAQMAVLFELQDLKEVSEQTGDRIKFICSHKVTGRVKLHRIINPEAWQSRKTYLRVEGTLIDDGGKTATPTAQGESASNKDENSDIVNFVYSTFTPKLDETNPIEEKLLRNSFADLVELQHELEEDVRFTRASVISLAVKPGSSSDGLWQTIKLWQSFADQRLMARQNELQQDFQIKLQEFLRKEKGLKDDELPSAIGFQDLSPSLQKEVTELQKRMAVELQPLILESTLTMQKILEAKDHTARLKLVRHFIIAETKRLQTKKAIKGMFSGASKTTTPTAGLASASTGIPPEEQILSSDDLPKRGSRKKDQESSSNNTPSSFFADDDAFQ